MQNRIIILHYDTVPCRSAPFPKKRGRSAANLTVHVKTSVNGLIAASFSRKTVDFSANRICNKSEKNQNGTKCRFLLFISAHIYRFKNAWIIWVYPVFLYLLVKKQCIETTKILRNMKIMLELRLFFAKIQSSAQTSPLSKNGVPENGRSKAANTACQKSAFTALFNVGNLRPAPFCPAA